jgi:sarcosine oxidase subunit gamma
MSETVAADLGLLDRPVTAPGVRVAMAPAMTRAVLRAHDAALLSSIIARPVPARIGDVVDGIACLGPDEWLALLPERTELESGAGQPVSVVDVSSRAVGIVIEGPGAAALVATGCPLDVERMAVGRATRSVFETVEIVLWRKADSMFHIEVWRSFAPWLCAALVGAVSL